MPDDSFFGDEPSSGRRPRPLRKPKDLNDRALEGTLPRDPSDESIEISYNDAPGLPTVGADVIFAPLPKIPYIVEGLHIAPGRPTLVAGYGYSGKTVALQSLALSVATGQPVWGVFSPRRGPVLHLDWEQGARLSYRRYQRLAAGMGVSERDINNLLRAAVYPLLRIDDANAEDVLSKACEGKSLVICDSFTASTGHVDENSSEAGRPLYMLGRVSDKTGATIVVVHHARKPQKDAAGGARMAIRGSGAIFGAADSVFVFAAEKSEPVRVSHERSPSDGQHLADFGLKIEDVAVDGDQRGGLRVVHLEPEQMTKPETTSDALHEELLAKVRDGLRKHPDVAGVEALASRVKARLASVRVAIRELEATGEVVNLGTKARPKLRLIEVPNV